MSDSTRDRRDAARNKAMSHFQKAEKRDEQIRADLDKERAATEAKTAKLRALRLARDAEEAAEAERVAATKPAKKPSARIVSRASKVAAE